MESMGVLDSSDRARSFRPPVADENAHDSWTRINILHIAIPRAPLAPGFDDN
jgi:hypothetical protein